MAWFKVDDDFADHTKLEELEHAPERHAFAVAAWTLLGVDCARRRTDGVVTHRRIERVLPWPSKLRERACADLQSIGLWDEHPKGFQYHDWADYQPTKAELDDARKQAAERQRRYRERRRQEKLARNDNGNDESNALRDALVTHDVTRVGDAEPVTETRSVPRNVSRNAAPSRPVPSRPESSLREERERARPRAAPSPLDFSEETFGQARKAFRQAYKQAFEAAYNDDLWAHDRWDKEVRTIGRWIANEASKEGAALEKVAAALVQAIFGIPRLRKARARHLEWVAKDAGAIMDEWLSLQPQEATA